jgi:UDP-N-acetylglucosamine acyltransferase
MIHPTAIVSPEAKIGEGTNIGPLAVVEAGAEIGERCIIRAHAVVTGHSVLGPEVDVHSFAVIGGPPQSVGFDESKRSIVRIGAGTILRESVTVQRSMFENGETIVGGKCFLMAYAHVGHDCVLGENVIMANNVMLAGHVELGNNAFVGGGTGIQQRTRIGEAVMLGGLVQVTQDIPPFTLCGERNEISGLNLIGLKRRNVPRETIAELKSLFVRVYRSNRPISEASAILSKGGVQSAEGRRFLEFFAGCKKGVSRPRRRVGDAEAAES